MTNCIFCNIANKEAQAEITYEDSEFIVFSDIHRKAPIHLLVIPKKHIVSLQEVSEHDTQLLGNLLLTAKKVAQDKQLKGYKLQMNVGKDGGQEVNHIHVHILANKV
jgi:histidine triad (HIT) family protein